MQVSLRPVQSSDLPTLFRFQSDADANRMAAMLPRPQADFDAHWNRILGNASVTAWSIVAGGSLAGSICCFECDGVHNVGYWVGKEFWGQGVATTALELLLAEVNTRPLHARVAVENLASIRVLQKCGFQIIGHQHSPGTDVYVECEEAMLKLPDGSLPKNSRLRVNR